MDLKITNEEVPIVSLHNFNSIETRELIDYACREWGFFQLLDHGIDASLILEIMHEMKLLFSQSTEIKRQISRTEANPWGFYDQELTKNIRDWKEIYDYGPAYATEDGSHVEPQWPLLPNFREVVSRYYHQNELLAFQILDVVAKNLGAGPEILRNGYTSHHTSFLRMNYYPICPQPEAPSDATEPDNGYLGINKHTDAGALTLLLQDDQPGLQVFHEGRWKIVPPVNGAMTINIGDIVQVWSNDQYKAALHRVLANAEKERYSIPFFFNPSYETIYEPLPSTVSSENPRRYEGINWGEFRKLRAAGDYASQGDEIQISQFRIH
jgi:isopenicillin N synthase-like dioxygenase